MVDLLRQGKTSGREFVARLTFFGVFVGAAFLLLIGRLYHLQISQGRDYAEKSLNNFVKEVRIPADRGQLVDRHGEVLAEGRPSYDLYLTPYFCGKACDEVVTRLASYLSLADDEQKRIRKKLAESRGLSRFKPFLLKVDIGRDLVDVFAAHRAELDGIDLLPTPHRSYKRGTLAGHALGYLSEVNEDELDQLQEQGLDYHEGDYIGRRGVERAFEDQLRGKDGAERVVVDAKGRRLSKSELADGLIPERERVRSPRAGKNLILTLDAHLQEVAEQAFPGQAGAVVALDPRTGYVLVLMSRPELDPNRLTGRITKAELDAMAVDPLQPEVFRALQQQYHPGSTFKTVVALAALEHGTLGEHSSTFCNGGYSFGGRRWRCDKVTGHGTMDVHTGLRSSCDTFFYWVAANLGLDPIAEMARSLGFGHPTGIGIGSEVAGVIPDVAYHNKTTPGGYHPGLALNAAIGQGDVDVTPLQMAVAYAAVANGGTVYRPQLVQRIEDAEGKTLKTFPPEVRGRVELKPETLRIVREALKAVVNEPGGTAYGHRLKDVEVAGKTGTAQVVAMGAERVNTDLQEYWHKDHGWFAGFAPADEPEILVVAINEHGGWGASSSAPTVMAVIEAYFEDKRRREAPLAPAPPEGPKSSAPADSPTEPPSGPKPKLGLLSPGARPGEDAAWN